MGVFPIGRQRVGVELDLPALDDDDQPTYTEFGEPITAATKAWVDNALFEILTPDQQQGLVVTTNEVARAFLPVADSVIPAVDDDGDPAPIPFFDAAGNPTITTNAWLWHNGLRYSMTGDAVLEQDSRGRQDHVRCICDRQQG